VYATPPLHRNVFTLLFNSNLIPSIEGATDLADIGLIACVTYCTVTAFGLCAGVEWIETGDVRLLIFF